MNDGKGYPIPDVIDPGSSICIPVLVPNDVLYIASFWHAYEHFGKWLAWQRDDAQTGAAVAAVWQPLIEASRAAWETTGCGGDPVDLRQNPEFPCKLERDDGEGWVQWADVASCLTILNNPLPPFPEETPEDAKKHAAQNIVGWLLERLYITTADALDAGTPQQDIANNVANEMSAVAPGKNVQAAAEYFVDKLAQQTQAERDDKRNPAYWEELYWAFDCKARGDGAILDQAADAIFGWLERSSEWIFDALNIMAGEYDGGDWGRVINTAEGAGFGSAEDNGWDLPDTEYCAGFGMWYQYIDFTTGLHGFEIVPLPEPQGEHVAGVGMRQTVGGACNLQTNERCIFGFHNFNSYIFGIEIVGNLIPTVYEDGWDCDSLVFNPVQKAVPGAGAQPPDAVFFTDFVLYCLNAPLANAMQGIHLYGVGPMPDFT